MTVPNTACGNEPMDIRLHGIAKESITDGPGFRYAIFTQGCPHQCDGCHNPASHSFTDGVVVPVTTLISEFQNNPLLDGITLSGGEPFMQAAECAVIAAAARAAGLHVMLYSGYTFEEIIEQMPVRSGWADLLGQADILIDGRFEKNRKSMELRFRGSRNQRAIDVQTSLAAGHAVLAEI